MSAHVQDDSGFQPIPVVSGEPIQAPGIKHRVISQYGQPTSYPTLERYSPRGLTPARTPSIQITLPRLVVLQFFQAPKPTPRYESPEDYEARMLSRIVITLTAIIMASLCGAPPILLAYWMIKWGIGL